jgi:hypothetical protein
LIYYHAPLQLSELSWFPVVVLVQLLLSLGLRIDSSALTVHFPRHQGHPLEPADVVVFCDADHLSIRHQQPLSATPRWAKTLINLNPFTHLAVSYQEILFYDGPFGHWKWLLALGVASVGLFLFGYFLFDRLRDSFAEEV